jgi:hypothetical protein
VANEYAEIGLTNLTKTVDFLFPQTCSPTRNRETQKKQNKRIQFILIDFSTEIDFSCIGIQEAPPATYCPNTPTL